MTSSKLHLNDLASLDIVSFANQGAWLTLTHPQTGLPLVDADGNEWQMLLAGKDSGLYRKASSEAMQRRFADIKERMSPEAYQEEQINVLSVCVIDWKNFVKDGKVLEFNSDNAKQIVAQFPWIREQMEAFILSRERYFLANAPA